MRNIEYAGVEMYDPNSQKNSWPNQSHRLEFIKSYLLERIQIHKLSDKVHPLLDLCYTVINDEEIFNNICIGFDVNNLLLLL